MSKLFALKEWLPIQEAARYLSFLIGETVSEADIYLFVIMGKLDLYCHVYESPAIEIPRESRIDSYIWRVFDATTLEPENTLSGVYRLLPEYDQTIDGWPEVSINATETVSPCKTSFNLDYTLLDEEGRRWLPIRLSGMKRFPWLPDTRCLDPIDHAIKRSDLESLNSADGGRPIRAFERGKNEHRSNELQFLIQASDKLWANADRNDRTTHPKNSIVEVWLLERGFTERLAKAGASIIRPEWAPLGRKPEE